MRLPGYLIGFTLAVLLVSTTPVGTGVGLHQFDLLHPLFSHVHVVNGRVMTHEQMAQAVVVPRRAILSVAVQSGWVATPGEDGGGINPSLPGYGALSVAAIPWAWPGDLVSAPAGTEEAPPDPPPL